MLPFHTVSYTHLFPDRHISIVPNLCTPFTVCNFLQADRRLWKAPVSYTHLDVYKRQSNSHCIFFRVNCFSIFSCCFYIEVHLNPVSYTHLDVYKRQLQRYHVTAFLVYSISFHFSSLFFIFFCQFSYKKKLRINQPQNRLLYHCSKLLQPNCYSYIYK